MVLVGEDRHYGDKGYHKEGDEDFAGDRFLTARVCKGEDKKEHRYGGYKNIVAACEEELLRFGPRNEFKGVDDDEDSGSPEIET
jgi:hypothetical protein